MALQSGTSKPEQIGRHSPHKGFSFGQHLRSLRVRTLLVVFVAMVALLIACYIPLEHIQHDNVLKLEQQSVITDIERARQSIDSALQRMSTLAYAYSAWDDTYHYVSAPTQFYIDENFNQTWMQKSDIDIVIITNQVRQPVYKAYQNLSTQQFEAVPQDILDRIQADAALTTFASTGTDKTGLLNLRAGPLLYIARPITYSDGSGVPAGCLIFGRFLDQFSMAKLGELTRFPITVGQLNTQTELRNGQPVAPLLSYQDDIAVPYDQQTVEGFGLIHDLEAQPSLILRIERPREFYLESRAGVQKVMVTFVTVGTLISLLLTLLIDRVVLLRLLRLNANVRSVGARGDLAARVVVDGNDELADLGAAINQMLYALECAEHHQLAIEREHRSALERMNAQLQANLVERERVERLKSEFIALVSHELRTPLTAIRGALGLVNGGVAGDVPDKVRAMLSIAYLNSERLVRLINDILDTEKIEAGRIAYNLTLQPLGPLLQQAIAQNQSYADQYSVNLALNILADNPALVDADRMLQVLTNLISNAAKFSPPATTVCISLNREEQQAVITVRDHGIGIPLDFQARVFERFAQADASNTRQKGGTGLGLSITKSLVEGMGGTITFNSVPGAGTTFRVALPLAD